MLSNVFLVILFVLDFAIVYMIYFYNPSGTINRFLSLLIIPIMLSNIEILLLRTVDSILLMDIGLNMAFLDGLAFFPIFYHFSYYYPRNVMTSRRKRMIIGLYADTAIVALALFFSYLYKPETLALNEIMHFGEFLKMNPVFFTTYIIMFIYIFILLVLTIIRFVKSFQLNLLPVEKRNVTMILAGFVPMSILLIFSYFIFQPLRSGINVFLIVSTFFTCYFIILLLSFGFLDKKAALRALFNYPVTIIIILVLFNYGLSDINNYFCEILNLDLPILLVVEIMIVFLILQPLIRFFESRLIKGGPSGTSDFHKLVKDVSQDLVGIISLVELNKFLVHFFIKQLNINVFHLMVADESDGFFKTIENRNGDNISFSVDCELAGKLEGYRKIMNIQQMSLAWHEGEELAELYKRKIVLIAPLFEQHKLIGFCLLGDPGRVRAWYPAEIDELELFLSGVPFVIARCHTHERAIALEKKQALIEKMAVLSEISSGIAHEIRNPLSIISASAETMAVKDLSSNEVKRFASYIQDETTRMNKLLNRILSISINSEIRHGPVNVIQVLQRVLNLVSSKLRKKNLLTDFSYVEYSCMALVDSEVLIQVGLNLILNAVDAMSDGMKLRIRAEYSGDTKVKIVFANQGKRIPVDIRSRIFDPFFTTKKAGTGLGLSITKRLIKEASGEIILLDSENETVFQILLPAASGFIK